MHDMYVMFYKIESHKFPTVVNHNNLGMSLEFRISGADFYKFWKKYIEHHRVENNWHIIAKKSFV